MPAQWSKTSQKVINAYNLEMCQLHPVLWLCSNHWKAELLATKAYPSWYQTHSKLVKTEEAPTVIVAPPEKKVKKKRASHEIDETDDG